MHYCITHQESPYTQLLWLNNVMTTVVPSISFAKGRVCNSCQIKELLNNLDSVYSDFINTVKFSD